MRPPSIRPRTLTSAFLNSQPLKQRRHRRVGIEQPDDAHFLLPVPPAASSTNRRSWLAFAASRGSSSHSTSSHPSSCLNSVLPLEPCEQTTICRSTVRRRWLQQRSIACREFLNRQGVGPLPRRRQLDGWPAQARNRSPAASKCAASRPASTQPRGDVATIPNRGDGRLRAATPATSLNRRSACETGSASSADRL